MAKNQFRTNNKPNNGPVDFSKLHPRRFDDTKNKEVWANYVNMARQNLFQTLMHITKVLGLRVIEQTDYEGNLMMIPAVTVLSSKKMAEQKEKAMKMYDKHFPFLTPMIEKYFEIKKIKQRTPEVYYDIMSMILPLMNLLRNKYSHFKLNDNRLNDNERIIEGKMVDSNRLLAIMLNSCMDGARRVVKERFGTGENTTLQEKDFEFLTGDKRTGSPRMYSELKEVNEEKNGRVFKKTIKVFKERPDFKYRVIDNDCGMSNIGYFMLICLFLEKRYASEFADQVDLFDIKFKAPEIVQTKMSKEIFIMREIISVYRMRLPKERLQSTRDESALALDILNELKKCPAELFDTLSPADQEKFRVEVDEDDAANTGCDLDGKILLKRFSDRFPTLALQYIDQREWFKDIRFQVELGNYRFKFYKKEGWIDNGTDNENEERVRVLQKPLSGFGRLQEIEKERNVRWKDIVRKIDQPRHDTLETKPYITDHHATYLITNNRIGLMWNTEGNAVLKNGLFMPKIPAQDSSSTEASDNIAPLCWLSIFDLPAVIFLSLLTGSGEKAERIIKDKVANYRNLFAGIAKGEVTTVEDLAKFGIRIKDVPYKLQEYLNGKKVEINVKYESWAEGVLNIMLKQTKLKLERFKEELKTYGTKENKAGKKSFIDIRPGTLARFVAEDIMFFSESGEDGKTRMTNQNFNILQASLAQFSCKEDWENLKTMFRAGELTKGQRQHPFLNVVVSNSPSNFFQFYEFYLKAREEYLDKCIGDKKNWKSLHFLYPERVRWAERDSEFYQELAKRYGTIELPHDIFFDAIIEALKEIGIYEKMQVGERENVTSLIQKYFKAIDDAPQDFYGDGFKRYYKYVSMTHNPKWDTSTPIISLKKAYYSVSEMETFRAEMAAIHPEPKDRLQAEKEIYYDALGDKAELTIERKKRSCEKTGRPFKDWMKKSINEAIEEELDAIKAKERGTSYNGQALDALDRLHAAYTNNEKTIRRYKVQDMLLFLMAKDALAGMNGKGVSANFSAYKLRDIGAGSKKDILSQQLPFSIVLEVPTGDANNPVRTIKISQDNLKLKNYGDFFRFIYDHRISSLLVNAKGEAFTREMLEEELDKYNQVRIHTFKIIHEVEGKVWKLLPKDKLHPEDKVVDFKYLLEFVNIKESNKDLIKAIRNAFCHNEYPKNPVVARIVFDKTDIPEIAKQMSIILKNKTSQINLKEDID